MSINVPRLNLGCASISGIHEGVLPACIKRCTSAVHPHHALEWHCELHKKFHPFLNSIYKGIHKQKSLLMSRGG